jgi:hypothetical protein
MDNKVVHASKGCTGLGHGRCVFVMLMKWFSFGRSVGVFCSRWLVSVTLASWENALFCCFGFRAGVDCRVDTRDWSEVKTIRPQGVALFVAVVRS